MTFIELIKYAIDKHYENKQKPCVHDFMMVHDVEVTTDIGGTYYVKKYLCKKCGKVIEIESNEA